MTIKHKHLIGMFFICLGLGFVGCDAPSSRAPVSQTLALYQSLADGQGSVDVDVAREMFSSYRKTKGLSTLQHDPLLQTAARREAENMRNKAAPTSADEVKRVLSGLGVAPDSLGVNISAGYHTLAEAFSGWRESATHNGVLLRKDATHMGIATVSDPQSKYKVYWVLILAKR
jgi:uncharacterized protein YkwD